MPDSPISYSPMPSPTLAGRTVLITGAASGIGAATARLLAGQGCRIIAMDRNEAGLEAMACALADGGAAVEPVPMDVTDAGQWADLAPLLVGRLGPLDHVVANAGIAAGGRIGDLDLAAWRRVMAVNLDGAFLTLKHGLAALRAGPARPRSMVVVGSAAGLKPLAAAPSYAVSKAAVLHLAKCVALDAADDGIRVNAICPGGVKTAIWQGEDFDRLVSQCRSVDGAFAALASASPLGRFAEAEEIAGHIAFLLDDGAGFMTGAVHVADGGYAL